MSKASKRFRVAFSFAGEKRQFVADVAAILAARFSESAILYDRFHEAEFGRRDLVYYLPELYHDQSDLVVVVLCPEYEKKQWCGLEWDATFDLIKNGKNSEVMLCRFEHATVKGIYSGAGFVELDDKTPDLAAIRILERLALNEGNQKDYYLLNTPKAITASSGGDFRDDPSRPFHDSSVSHQHNFGFLSEFVRRHEYMTDRPFCWVLGSGASVQSGIPSGGRLAQLWLDEMYEMESHESSSIEAWATAENLGIPGFEYIHAERYYPWLYQRRFLDYKEQGYAFLERILDRAEPSFGYSVLAQIMATTQHKVAVTTNFDNLIADALSMYTRALPLVCGHESQTGYIRPNLRRPLVAKIYRDFLLAPLSNPEQISWLPHEWSSALTKIFSRFTPIIIGYGGNDGSLMNFLKALDPIEGGIFWCHRLSGNVDPAVSAVVNHHRGKLVPIVGFDELMLQLAEKLQLPSLLPQLQSVYDNRRENYQRQFEALAAALSKPAESVAAEEARKPAREAAEATVERLTKEKDWWAWQLKANAEPNPEKREAIYRAGLEDFPQSAPFTSSFGLFMHEVRKNYDEAERIYRCALELDPKQATTRANLAALLRKTHQNDDEVESLYRRALELDPYGAETTRNFAHFMCVVRKNQTEADRLFERALEIDSSDAITISTFARFLISCGQSSQAREQMRRAEPGIQPSIGHAELAYTLWLLDRATAREGARALGRLKIVINTGFARATWWLDDLLVNPLPLLTERDYSLACKMSAAILDEKKVAALDDEPLWKNAISTPMSVSWQELVEDGTTAR